MAKLAPTYSQTDIGVAINRSNGQPLDSTEIWRDLTSLNEYIKTDQAYVGQRVTYIDEVGKTHRYVIEGEGDASVLVKDNERMVFIGTMAAYEEAYAAGQIAIGTIVIIDEPIDDEPNDDEPNDDGDETIAILGKAILGKMILGKG